MKFYLVFLQNTTKDGNIVIKGRFESNEEAKTQLTQIALDHVRADGGDRQASVAFQNDKSLEEISTDINLNPGLYLKENDGIIEVYEKTAKEVGYLMSNIKYFIEKIAVFSTTEIDFEVPERFSCGCNVKKSAKVVKQTIPRKYTFLEQLSSLLKSGNKNFGLKPTNIAHS